MLAARQLCEGSRRVVQVRRFSTLELTKRCPVCGDQLIVTAQRGSSRDWAMTPSHIASGTNTHRISEGSDIPWRE